MRSEATEYKTATILRAAGGGHLLMWTRDYRETVSDQIAEQIADALDPFTMKGTDQRSRQPMARQILDEAEYRGTLIYREWTIPYPEPEPEPAKPAEANAGQRSADVQLHAQDPERVIYYDAGAGVYLAWYASTPDVFVVESQDRQRTLGEIETAPHTRIFAARAIRRMIADPTKAYGEEAGLWTKGD